jgi:DNA-binding transcriptional ArsR family regulator
MSVTIDVSGVSAERFVFAPSPVAELSSAIHLLVEPTHHPTQAGWSTATTATIEPSLVDRLLDADFLWRTSRADMLLPAEPGVTLGDDLDRIDTLDDEAWVGAALITSSCGTVPLYRNLKSPLVDDNARDLARERALARGPRQIAFVDFVLGNPPRARTLVRRLLEDCERAFFADAWKRIVSHLAADARLKRDLLARYGLERTLAAISPAVSLSDSGSRIIVDKLLDSATSAEGRGVSFLPSAFGHPHLLVVHAPGWAPVIQYPVDTGGAVDETSPIDDVQRRIHALDNPVRLRLARSLIRGPKTTTELANTMGVSAPDISHQLAVLKAAGLVATSRRGRYVTYHLELTAIARIGRDTIESLLR